MGPFLVRNMFASKYKTQTVRSPQRKQGYLVPCLRCGLQSCAPVVQQRGRASRPGIALLICLFVLSLVSVWTVDMLESASVYQSAQRNAIEYEQALYQASAGVQHALSQLETDVAWRGTVTAGSYPASGSYSATAVNGAVSGTVDVTSTGVAGATARRVQATILVN
jgi:Tfp pilus assembly protein PilX